MDGYNDDLSDSEMHYSEDQPDEQHAQKVNGKIEALQRRVEELEKELRFERKEHENTKHRIGNKDDNNNIRQFDTDLKNEFIMFCIKNSINVPGVNDANDINNQNYISILKSASQVIKSTKDANRPNSRINEGSTDDLLNKIKNLEYELRIALGAAEDIRALKTKLIQVLERIRIEKEGKIKVEQNLQRAKKKIEMLGDHMEKLMNHLKHEAASKVKAMEQLRVNERTMHTLKEKSAMISRKSSAKDRLILEIREGSKILEDQLRLMDEKYLELRSKLDYARESGIKKIKQAEKTASDLRLKFTLAGNTTPLDSIQLPQINNGSLAGSEYDQQSWASSTVDSKKSKKSKLKSGRSVGTLESNERIAEPSMDIVLEKIRKQQGASVEWSDQKLRDLAKSR
jgi:hypothetical protein